MARFELVDANSSLASLDDNQRTKIQEFINSFPMWMTDIPAENIQVMYGVSSR